MATMKVVAIFGIIAICLAGCGPEVKKPLALCPGKATADEAIAALGGQVKNLMPLKASGDCWYVYDANGKKREEQLRVQVRIEPPLKVYLQGSSIIGKAVELGANDRQFWMALKPKEISTYLWGDWGDEGVRQCLDKLWLGPNVWLEAFGVIKTASSADAAVWELSHEGAYDILSRKDRSGRLTKKIYIYCCDYLVRKIEYFDEQGRETAVTELDDYVAVVKGGGWKVPRMVKVTGGKGEMVTIELSDVGKAQFTDKQRQILFERPSSEGFEHVGRVNAACEFVEESGRR